MSGTEAGQEYKNLGTAQPEGEHSADMLSPNSSFMADLKFLTAVHVIP